jgi:hypothetical protein
MGTDARDEEHKDDGQKAECHGCTALDGGPNEKVAGSLEGGLSDIAVMAALPHSRLAIANGLTIGDSIRQSSIKNMAIV